MSGSGSRAGQRAAGSGAEPIRHLTTPDVWAGALGRGSYLLSTRGRTLAEVGFIHCAYPRQVIAAAERLYPDTGELLLLVIDPGRLSSPLRAENLEGGDELFPHLYGPLELVAVARVLPMTRGGDGRFRLPAVSGLPRL